MRHRPTAVSFACILLTASTGISQAPDVPSHYVEVRLPAGVSSETVYIRYVLAGEKFGGLVRPRAGVSSYLIDTSVHTSLDATNAGLSSAGVKAILYAPGCAIQTFDLTLSNSNNEKYAFACRPLGNVWIAGTVAHPDRLYGLGVDIEVKYFARWAAAFLGLDDTAIPVVPVGDVADLSADGGFRISVPDFSALPGQPARAGELRIWAKDKATGDLVALLVPTGLPNIKTRMGGLAIQSDYPAGMVFTPCDVNSGQTHDKIGFAIRPDSTDTCTR